ncbi:MAG: HrpE/YscL family type III secretion apparatus protein [Puniceicoccales bacterium]|jgi:type III secretion protein L|nr:HrpE/YscL family type III secretion apparatus protein [Puniceicoccales bacterium]
MTKITPDNTMGIANIYEISIGSFDLKQSGKILKAKSYANFTAGKSVLTTTKKKCDEIFQEANQKSNQIIRDAETKANEIIEQAKQTKKQEEERGYAEGFENGKQQISNEMMSFVSKSASSFSRLEGDVVEVVKSALRKIIGKIDKTELIVSVVRNSLQKIKTQKQATLKVAPGEAQVLRDKVQDLTKDTPVLEFLDICADTHLQPGSCILETELGVIDASIPVQLTAIENALSKAKSR